MRLAKPIIAVLAAGLAIGGAVAQAGWVPTPGKTAQASAVTPLGYQTITNAITVEIQRSDRGRSMVPSRLEDPSEGNASLAQLD